MPIFCHNCQRNNNVDLMQKIIFFKIQKNWFIPSVIWIIFFKFIIRYKNITSFIVIQVQYFCEDASICLMCYRSHPLLFCFLYQSIDKYIYHKKFSFATIFATIIRKHRDSSFLYSKITLLRSHHHHLAPIPIIF